MSYKLNYKPGGAVARAYVKHRPAIVGSDLPIDVIVGPIGSGKTVGTAVRIFMHALEQPPGADGWRRSKWLAVRNTGPMLETTTIPSWLSWFPEEHFGPFNWSPPYSHTLKLPALKVELEMLFMPLDRPDQVRAALGLELTGVWANEMRELAREIVINLRSRCGRFPSLRDGVKPGWAGVLGDTNAPEDELHYLCLWAGWTTPPDWYDAMTRQLMDRPANVSFFVQPPGLLARENEKGEVVEFLDNPEAENLTHLRPGYYRSQLPGNTSAWVLNMVCVKPRQSTPTRVVHPDFRKEVHVAPAPLRWDPTAKWGLFAMDFARNPALLLAQEVGGQLRILAEWIGQGISVESFLRDAAMPKLNIEWPEALKHPRGWGDPSGTGRTGGDDSTAFIHARKQGMVLVPAWTNDPDQRCAAVDRRLRSMVGGTPALLISPTCRTLIGGLGGGYRILRKRVTGTIDQFDEEPEKNLFSHVCDGLQYLCLGVDRGSKQSSSEQRRSAAEAGPLPNGRVKHDPLGRHTRRFTQ